MKDKKAQQAFSGFGTLGIWVFIIGVGIILLIILGTITGFWQDLWDMILELPFI